MGKTTKCLTTEQTKLYKVSSKVTILKVAPVLLPAMQVGTVSLDPQIMLGHGTKQLDSQFYILSGIIFFFVNAKTEPNSLLC